MATVVNKLNSRITVRFGDGESMTLGAAQKVTVSEDKVSALKSCERFLAGHISIVEDKAPSGSAQSASARTTSPAASVLETPKVESRDKSEPAAKDKEEATSSKTANGSSPNNRKG